ncbi:MAG: acyl-CoA dehydrogenase family protein [Gemmatales bacterium]|nr:acyl-CoA dehydrogenase family protein [Gemmatales bacterium]MCS7159289.1 acyl-CoA dehydrogenase family protein [Gemmatales bacterium]MDW8174489.1 acyl-CoA dehydrogenase family protein [Gemmatales bacterium]MDW8224071.1 acyl-CoA dehydrogenase family protein [Gemmatales bacterium]
MDAAKREKLLRDVEAFCEEIRPIEELCYLERRFNEQVVPLAKKYGLLGMPVPEEYGGRGADAITYAQALARINREGTGVRTFFSGHTSIGQIPVLYFGTPEQKQRLLPASCRGDKIFAFALTEPDAGSNPLEMSSTWRREGDTYVLNGVKYLISNGGIANVLVTFAYPESALQQPAEPGRRAGRISAFLAETDGPGLIREELPAKMGMPTCSTAMLELRELRIPASNLLGREGDGFRIAMTTLISGRLSVAAGCLGVIEDCLAESLRYARERQQHGKAIGKHQLVQQHLAWMETYRAAVEALVLSAAQAKQRWDDARGHSSESDRAGEHIIALYQEADRLTALAKLFASQAAWEVADRAVQLFGGRGWSVLFRPGRHLLDVRVCRIYEGTDEILQLKIASMLLGKDYEAYR